jgi:hypothetical protein
MATKSGKYWVTWANTHAKNSNKVGDLEVTFKGAVKAFIKALKDAGATVDVSTTKRELIFSIGLGRSHKGSASHLMQKR